MGKAAFVALIGRPSVGKSTLTNTLCKEKVAIVSAIPQTTRNAIRGIVNRPEGQLVFIDSPGRHQSEKKFNKRLREVSNRTVESSDICLYMLDATRLPGIEEEAVVSYISKVERLVLAINKIDSPEAQCPHLLNFIREKFPSVPEQYYCQISALTGEGIAVLLQRLFDYAPEGEAFYPSEYYTDQKLDFRIAEIIREKAIEQLYAEIPYSLYAEVADAELSGNRLWVRAFLVTERESQKAMVVGKGGAVIKIIRLNAQKELNRLLDWKVTLDLRVKTVKDWRHRDSTLKKLIW
ncbi:MAG: GTPase Era [Treponema sp.]|jgi:GTP-binding protein Era|nr:GTPase Era [Treponema sp.]